VIGVVGQRSGVDPDATGRENLSLQARIHGLGRSGARRRVEELLGGFGLDSAADRPARTYSGGMQRRLDIAIGLVHRPAVLFLDEPTTGLDPEVRADLWSLITGLTRDEGLTILLTTHYLEEADQLAARMAIVERGRVVVEGSPEVLKAELRGDTVQIALVHEANGRVGGALRGLSGVREAAQDGRTVRARVDEGATAVPALLAALESVGAAVASVSVSRPSLDDVYLRHVGRAFAGAGDSPGGGSR
jgi:ABC-2 type transport system ATP-binding protein